MAKIDLFLCCGWRTPILTCGILFTLGCGRPCAPQDVRAVESRVSVMSFCGTPDDRTRFYWDGARCVQLGEVLPGVAATEPCITVRCEGADCGQLYATRSACEGAHDGC